MNAIEYIIKLSLLIFMSTHLINARKDPQGAPLAQDSQDHAGAIGNYPGEQQQDTFKQERLHAAILNDSAEQVYDAIKNGANPNKEMEPPVRAGTQMPNRKQPNPTPKQSPLSFALLMKHQNAVQALLDGGAKPDEQLIRNALEQKQFNNALLFLKKDPTISEAEIDYCMATCIRIGLDPLATIPQITTLEIIQELINHGYNVNHIWFTQTGGGSPNFYWNDDALKLFLRNGANPNFIYINGAYSNTPLLQAIAYTRNNKANLSGIKILLNAGANINQKANPEGYGTASGAKTPLAFASSVNVTADPDLITFLREKGGVVQHPVPAIQNKQNKGQAVAALLQ